VAKLDTIEAALKVATSQMRQRCRELLHPLVASAGPSPEETEEELHALFAALSR
jgi:hypothetical protein